LVRPAVFLILILLGLMSLFPNINLYEFRGEESLRVIVAYEMRDSGNYLQPTFLGDLYFNKPPLFNWFIVASSYLIPWSELTGRIVSIVFLSLTLLLIYHFTKSILKNRATAAVSSLVYLIFVDILFWYGYLAEIDVTLAFFVFLMFVLLYHGYFGSKPYLIVLSGVVTGLSFLLKGFPAYVFWGLTVFTFILYKKRFKDFIHPVFWFSGIIALAVPLLWIISTANPELYLKRLLVESLVRAEGSSNISKFITHLFLYPLLNFKQLLPVSGVVLALVFYARRNGISLSLPPALKILLITAFVNYLPYLLAVNSRGRYVIPLFPVLSVIFGYLIYSTGKDRWTKAVVYISIFLIFSRFMLGVFGFPILMEKKASRKRVAYKIADIIQLDKEIACDCKKEKSICLYLDFLKGSAIKTSRHTENWKYLIDCSDRQIEGTVIESFDLKGKIVKLYERNG